MTKGINDNYWPAINKADHLALLRRAIAANLDALEAHRHRRAESQPPTHIYPTMWAAEPLEKLHLDSIIKDPARRALKEQLKKLGQQLFDIVGSTDAMRDVADEVANLNPRKWGARAAILDKGWDGVGSDKDRWVA